MRRLIALVGAMLIGLLILAPAVLAADELAHNGRVLVSIGGDVTLPAGEQADVVVVVGGTATIRGDVNTIVTVDGTADLLGARTETLVAVRSRVELGPDAVVLGTVRTLDATVHQTGNAEIVGGTRDLSRDFIGLGIVLAPALFLLYLGFGLAAIVAGMALAWPPGRSARPAS